MNEFSRTDVLGGAGGGLKGRKQSPFEQAQARLGPKFMEIWLFFVCLILCIDHVIIRRARAFLPVNDCTNQSLPSPRQTSKQEYTQNRDHLDIVFVPIVALLCSLFIFYLDISTFTSCSIITMKRKLKEKMKNLTKKSIESRAKRQKYSVMKRTAW